MQRCQCPAEPLFVSGRPSHLVNCPGDQEVGLHHHHIGYRRCARHLAELPEPVGLVPDARTDLDHNGPRSGLDQPSTPTEWTAAADRTDGANEALEPGRSRAHDGAFRSGQHAGGTRRRRGRCSALHHSSILPGEFGPATDPRSRVEHDGAVTGSGPAGLVLTPGASAGRDQSSLVAIDRELSGLGVVVERVEFPGRTAGKRRPDPPDRCAYRRFAAQPSGWRTDSVSRPAVWPSAVAPWVAGCAPWRRPKASKWLPSS